MPRPQQAHSTTRRTLIRLGAAAGAALGVPAIAVADPIYDLIERHRATIRAWEAAGTEYGRLQEDWFALRPGPFEEPPVATAAAIADAEERQDAMGDVEIRAADALVESVPTTLAGMLAAIRYVLAYFDGTSEIYPGQSHPLLSDNQMLTLLDTIGDAIEALLARGDGRR